jgi:hypothetical protein
MDMIAAEDVVRAIETYFRGGAISYLGNTEASEVEPDSTERQEKETWERRKPMSLVQ